MKQTFLYLWYPFNKITSDSTTKFSETDIINMLQSLIDNIVVIFGGRVFQQTEMLVPMKFGMYMYCDRDYIGQSQTPLLSNLDFNKLDKNIS
jgi:hypothetical protein